MLRENSSPPLFSILNFIPNSSFLLVIATGYTPSLQWANAPYEIGECVCVCESYSQHIVVSSCHSLLFTFFLCSGIGSLYHCRREKYLSLNWVSLSYSTFFFFKQMSYSMWILRIPAWHFCDKNQQDVAHTGTSYF